jgi:hypothetical protein
MSELTDEALTFRIHAMTLSARVVETAISLATSAGESVDRPLTDAQLKRAFDIHVAEDLILTRLLIDHAEFMELPEWEQVERKRAEQVEQAERERKLERKLRRRKMIS